MPDFKNWLPQGKKNDWFHLKKCIKLLIINCFIILKKIVSKREKP